MPPSASEVARRVRTAVSKRLLRRRRARATRKRPGNRRLLAALAVSLVALLALFAGALLTVREGKPEIEMPEVEEAVQRLEHVHRVSSLARGRSLGSTALQRDDSALQTRSELVTAITIEGPALGHVSALTHQEMEAEVDRLLERAEQEATALLTRHRDVLSALAERLEVEETIEGADLEAILAMVRPEVTLFGGVVAERPRGASVAGAGAA